MQITMPIYTVLVASLMFSSCAVSNNPPDKGAGPTQPDTVPAGYYLNPVFEPILADPSVVRDPETGDFFAYGTQDNWGDGQGSRLMPIVRSKDLVNWTVEGQAFETRPSWKSQGGLWAPDVSLINGKYHLYYSYSTWGDPNPGIGVAISDTPSGPFVDQGKLFDSADADVPNSIDPHYVEDGGKSYLFWGSFSQAATQGTYGVELAADGLSVLDLDRKFKIAAGDMEAVMIHRRGDFYYFFGSKGSCCEGADSKYHVVVARSENLRGPYLDRNGKDIAERGNGTLLLQGNETYAGPGHNARIVTDDEGTDWFLYHGIIRTQGKVSSGASRRALMIDRLEWVDGWPQIKGNVPSTTPQPAPVFH